MKVASSVLARFAALRPRAILSSVVVTALTAGLVVAAVQSDGLEAAKLDLNNGGVWVTRTAVKVLARSNVQLREFDATLTAGSGNFDLVQDGEQVVVVDSDRRRLVQVDTRRVLLADGQAQLPAGALVDLRGGTGALADPATGKLWVARAEGFAALDPAKAEPTATLEPGSAMAVSITGTVVGVAAKRRELVTVPVTAAGVGPVVVAPLAADVAAPALTTVGTVPVVLDGGRTLLLPGRPALELPATGVLQQPGPAASEVLVATDSQLLAVPLSGGSPRTVFDRGSGGGRLVAPVVVGGCRYAAWGGASASYFNSCDATTSRPLTGLPTGASLAFRVNRGNVALNDREGGSAFLLRRDGFSTPDNWDDARFDQQREAATNQQRTETEQAETTEECQEASQPPVATNDAFGARLGQVAVLPVLANDSDANCDPIAILPFEPAALTKLEENRIDIVQGGQALQFTSAPGKRDPVEFTYAIDDGRGGKATAQVSITIVPDEVNNPPRLLGKASRTVVEEGKSVVYNPLYDFVDPDGDPLELRDAQGPADDTTRFAPDGQVTFLDAGRSQGRKAVKLTVSDGRATTAGELVIDVQPARDLPPKARNDFAVALVDQTIVIEPLANDTDPNNDPLLLGEVQREVAGATVAFDPVSARVTFAAAKAGTYLVRYKATANGKSSPATIRVDVRESGSNSPPVPVRDTLVVTVGSVGSVDVVANDIDLDGDVLVVTGIQVPGGVPGLSATVVGGYAIRVTLTDPPGRPVSISYVVSDGLEARQGSLVVLAREPSARNQPPVSRPDAARVRAGDIVDIDVLANDVDPDGDRLSLVPGKLQAPAAGVLFVDGQRLRYRAPTSAGTYYATYVVSDGRDENSAQVTITVRGLDERNQPPRAVPLVGRVLAGAQTTIVVPVAALDPDGDSLTVTAPGLKTPTRGRIVGVEGATIRYEASANQPGTDEFTYRLDDGRGATAEGTVRVGIARRQANQNPVAVTDKVTALPGKPLRVAVLANDFDPDGDVVRFDDPAIETRAGIDATVIDDRIAVTAPAEPGTITIPYRITDGQGGRAAGYLTVVASLTPPTQPPVARDDVVRDFASDATSVTVDVRKNDDDPNGQREELVVSIPAGQDAPASTDGATVVVTLGDRPAKVAYTVTDTEGLSASAFVVVPARANQAPRPKPNPPTLEVRGGESVRLAVTDFAEDPEGQPLRLTEERAVSATGGAVRILDPTALAFTPAATFEGEASVTFEVIDRALDDPVAKRLKLTVPVRVLPPANQPPVVQPAATEIEAGGESTLDLRPFATDPNPNDRLTFAALTGGGTGVQGRLADGVLTLTAEASAPKGSTVRFGYTVSDGQAPSVAGAVDVRIVASARPLARANPDTVAKADQGKAVTVDVLANDDNPFPDTPLRIIEVQAEPAQATASHDGTRVTITPAAGFVGTATVRYRVQDKTNDRDRTVVGQVQLNVRGAPAKPAAPTVGEVRDKTVVLSWQPPTANGTPIIDYLVSSDQGYTKTCPTNTCTLDGLTNNVTYRFQVAARNEVGAGPVSELSGPARPDVKPNKAAAPTLTFGDKQITVTWTAPPTAGSPITGYDLEISPGGTQRALGTDTTLVWTGLRNGDPYRFRVRAKNLALEPGDWSDLSEPEIPAAKPARPAAPTASGTGGILGEQVTVNWTAPANNGAAITTYALVVYANGAETQRLTDSATSRVLPATNGVSYTFAVSATNKAGESELGPPSAAVVPFGKPAPVASVSAAPGNGIATLAFAAPNANGKAIVKYRVRYAGNEIDLAPNRVVSGLANGAAYAFQVAACNDFCGEFSPASAAITPFGPPGLPSLSTSKPGPTVVRFAWNPPAPNGRPIVGSRYSVNGGGWQGGGPSGVLDFGNGYSQTFSLTVCAQDSEGQYGQCASASNSTDPPPPPPPPPARTISTSKGGPKASTWCKNCNHVNVSGANFLPNTPLQVLCDGDPKWYSLTTSDGSGSFGPVQSVCFHDATVTQLITVRDGSGQASQVSDW